MKKGTYVRTEEHRLKMGEIKKLTHSGSGNPNYGKFKKGASYKALHQWLWREKPNVVECPICGSTKRIEAHNLSGEYKRDINDYIWVCSRCHKNRDGRLTV